MSFVGSEQTETTRTEAAQAEAAQAAPRGALVVREPHEFRESRELPAVLSMTPTVPGLLQAARRRWKSALFLGLLLGGAAAAGAWFIQPERFIARTTVLISEGGILNQQNKIDQRTQIALVKSRLLLNAALRDPNVAKLDVVQKELDPIAWLEKEIVADFSVAPDILRIQMIGEDPNAMRAIVSAVRKQYMDDAARREREAKTQRHSKLGEIYEEIEHALQQKQRIVRQLAEDLGGLKDAKIRETRLQLHLKQLETLQGEWLKTQSKLHLAEMELQSDPGSAKVALGAGKIEEAVQKDPRIKQYREAIAQAERNIEQVKQNLRDPENDPSYKQFVASRDTAKSNLAKLQDSIRKELNAHVEEVAKAADQGKKQDVLILREQVKWFLGQIDQVTKSFQDVGKKQVDVDLLQAEIKLESELADKIGLQKRLLQVEMQAPERFQPIDDSYSLPDTDTRIKKAGMAGGGVLALVVFGIAFLEFRSRRVSSVDEIVRGLRMRLVGALPNLPARSRNYGTSKRPADVKWQHQMAESVESARTMLLHAAENEALRVIAITSAVGGEGKTLTCSHLAASLARAGRNTLLIDADLRRPSLQKLFNLNPQVGLSELLRGDAEISAAVQETPIPGLSVIAAGTTDDRAIQALSQPVLAELIKQLRGQYDFVIVDTAPVLPVADSQVICQHADGVIFAVLRDVSRLPQIYSAHERLVSLKIRILGAIVNGTDGPVYGSSYVYSRTNHANAAKA